MSNQHISKGSLTSNGLLGNYGVGYSERSCDNRARGYLVKLFGHNRAARYLDQHHPDICRELLTLSEGSLLEN
jgi:hypothetical protein